jgi:hypothetical protein
LLPLYSLTQNLLNDLNTPWSQYIQLLDQLQEEDYLVADWVSDLLIQRFLALSSHLFSTITTPSSSSNHYYYLKCLVDFPKAIASYSDKFSRLISYYNVLILPPLQRGLKDLSSQYQQQFISDSLVNLSKAVLTDRFFLSTTATWSREIYPFANNSAPAVKVEFYPGFLRLDSSIDKALPHTPIHFREALLSTSTQLEKALFKCNLSYLRFYSSAVVSSQDKSLLLSQSYVSHSLDWNGSFYSSLNDPLISLVDEALCSLFSNYGYAVEIDHF